MKKLIWMIVCVAFIACNLEEQDTLDPVFCTTSIVAGLEITIKSASTGTIITDGIRVIIEDIDNDYREIVESTNSVDAFPSVFTGAFERAGAYTITVRGEGYKTYTSSTPVKVEADMCHVITEKIEIILSPNL